MPTTSRRGADRRALTGLRAAMLAAVVTFAALTGLASGPASAASVHADGPHRAPQALIPAGSAKARAAMIMCAKVAAKAGFSFTQTVATSQGPQPQIVVAIAVAMAESGCTPGAKNVNGGGSIDRGLWQMNSRWHPEVSDRCAYQIQCNANAAWTVSSHGGSWSPWSAYNNGSWKVYLGEARTTISDGFTFLLGNQGTDTCLAADSTAIAQRPCDSGDDHQRWTVTSAVGAAPILRNVAVGTCLVWSGKTLQACAADAAIQQFGFLGTGHLNTNGDADVLMKNDNAGTCLSATADQIRPGTCNNRDTYQMWL